MALKTVTREFEGFLEDRKSRFLAHLVPVDMFDQRMEELRKEHKKANHIVTAHRRLLEDDRIEESGKDDGEPAGTSGMPTLRVLQGADLINCAVLIVRYFGGTKLGGGAWPEPIPAQRRMRSTTPTWYRFKRYCRKQFAQILRPDRNWNGGSRPSA